MGNYNSSSSLGGIKLLNYIKDAIMGICIIFVSYWYLVLAVIALCITLPIIIRYLRALISRVVFWVKLSVLCRKNGATLTFKKFFLLSFIKNHASIDFRITSKIGDKVYDVKFFPLNPLRKIVYLNNSENAYVSKAAIQTYIGRKGALPGGTPTSLNYAETKPRKIKLFLPTPSEETKNILLFQPNPLCIRVFGGNNFQNASDSDSYRGDTIFEGEEFIAVDRAVAGTHCSATLLSGKRMVELFRNKIRMTFQEFVGDRFIFKLEYRAGGIDERAACFDRRRIVFEYLKLP